ncbi:hypothetical protein PRZ48_006739 [Zasmidium cellare]|uniref:Amidohydrolase-related domain-containing protein n=1 Tax=Zasmidium cellare TaxID=395010 RepID=A0ABR0ENY3_ZASCE|nr:hypothetical protein PRZ48_006739 [Zasmidium cellare]
MLGKISLEEAYELPAKADSSRDQAALYIAPNDLERYLRQIKSFTDERIELSDKHGIGYTIISLTVPGIQGIVEKKRRVDARPTSGRRRAPSLRERAWLPWRILNDVQHAGPDGETYLFYDQPGYDAFWKVAEELAVPIYIHPAAPVGQRYDVLYKERKYLVGPPLSFANGVSLHLLGIITNGVFDRFPNLQVIVGHLDVERPLAARAHDRFCKKDLIYYFKNKIYITTSGHFSTPTLEYVVKYLGHDRILFSVDYPYETIENVCGWWDGDKKEIEKVLGGEKAYYDVGRENAKKLFKVDGYFQSDA